MSESDTRKSTLNIKSASFMPKSMKNKIADGGSISSSATGSATSVSIEKSAHDVRKNSASSNIAGMMPGEKIPQIPGIGTVPKSDPLMKMMQLSNMMGSYMNMMNLGPKKLPPLLFTPPENLMNVHPHAPAHVETKNVKIITYSAEFMMSFRDKFKKKPDTMKELDFPHKSKTLKMTYIDDDSINPFNKKQQKSFDYNTKVLKIREWLNKLSAKNYNKISKYILTKFQYNPQLLKELSKILFIKAATEKSFSKIYIDLAEQLFKKFNDKENVEMNFKRLLLKKCQKEFYKDKMSDYEEDFSKGSLFVYDKEEINFQTKQKVFGNLKLIGELF